MNFWSDLVSFLFSIFFTTLHWFFSLSTCPLKSPDTYILRLAVCCFSYLVITFILIRAIYYYNCPFVQKYLVLLYKFFLNALPISFHSSYIFLLNIGSCSNSCSLLFFHFRETKKLPPPAVLLVPFSLFRLIMIYLYYLLLLKQYFLLLSFYYSNWMLNLMKVLSHSALLFEFFFFVYRSFLVFLNSTFAASLSLNTFHWFLNLFVNN